MERAKQKMQNKQLLQTQADWTINHKHVCIGDSQHDGYETLSGVLFICLRKFIFSNASVHTLRLQMA